MKHYELPVKTICHIYGHGDVRWLRLGPPPPSQENDERPVVLFCHTCEQTIDRST